MSRSSSRKSPYRHPVKDHMRKGRPVVEYERGMGDKPRSDPRRSRVVGGGISGAGEYDISIFYVGEAQEEFVIDAKSYRGALNASFDMRGKPLPPRLIRMRRSL